MISFYSIAAMALSSSTATTRDPARTDLLARIEAQRTAAAERIAEHKTFGVQTASRRVEGEIAFTKRALAGLEALTFTKLPPPTAELDGLKQELASLDAFAADLEARAQDGAVMLPEAMPGSVAQELKGLVDASRPDELTYLEKDGLLVVDAEQYTANTDGAGGFRWEANGADDRMIATEIAGDDDTLHTEEDVLGQSARLDYKAVFETAGTYHVWVRGHAAVAGDSRSNSVHVGINGEVASGTGGIAVDEDVLSWGTRDAYGRERVTITVAEAGEHTLNLWVREDGTAVDAFLLTQNSGYVPEGTSMGLSTISDTPGEATPLALADVQSVLDAARTRIGERITEIETSSRLEAGANPYLQKIIEAQEKGLAKIEGMAEREKSETLASLQTATSVTFGSFAGSSALGILFSYDLVSLYWQGGGGRSFDWRT